MENTFNKEVKHFRIEGKILKGEWWMPRLMEAKKDVLDCEKLRGAVKEL